ncbi:MAG: nitronate monooxygenase [Dehalococcoidia bacterium]|nr:nitronate monooxygenase [Dehalococcoidia bacterium]
MKKTRVCQLLGIEHPVIQAPMVWITWAELAAAVSNAGGLGVLGPNAGERTPTKDVVETGERLRRQIRKVRTLTSKPFGVNIILPLPAFPKIGKEFSDQTLKVAIEEKVPAVVLVGDGAEAYTEQAKKAGIKVLLRGSPMNVDVARRAEKAGVDCVIAVGFEGGGHVGADRLPTFVLVPQVVDAVKISVVAGGGIVDGRGMAAALALGAEGIYMGTRFMVTKECPTHDKVKESILHATDTSTAVCTGLYGVLRGPKNPLMQKCCQTEAAGGTVFDVSKIYGGGFIAGLLEGDTENGCISYSAAASMIHDIKSAGDVVRDIVREADQVIARVK